MRSRSLRVLDCADLTGAFCGIALGCAGARVEYRDDGSRRPPGGGPLVTPWYGPPQGRRPLGSAPPRLAAADLAGVDVVITTGRPSDLAAVAADYASLAALCPDIIVVNISPFGLSGPRAEWRAGNLVAAACGGMVAVNGWPDSPPLQPLGLQVYHVAGVIGAIGALLALRVREETGRGQLVDVSLQESAVAALEHVTGIYRERGNLSRRSGTLHWTRAFRTVPARDGEILASHLGDWDALCEWMAAGGGECLRGEPWTSPAWRRQHSEHVFSAIAAWSARFAGDELVQQAQARRLAFAPVNTLTQAADHPQLQARNFFANAHSLGFQVEPPLSAEDGAACPRATASEGVAQAAGCADRDVQRSALAGVRVVDLTWVVAGPVATRVLADHGAEVIKIEHPRTEVAGARRGGWFGNLNRGKHSVVLDLEAPGGRDTLLRLLAASDVLVENFSPRVLGNWGLDETVLRAVNPRLTVVHMSGFGRSGPLRDWVSYGPTLQAQLGFTAHMRHPGGPAAGWGYSFSDMISGYVAALAVLACLRRGGGRHVDLSQLEVLASMLGPELAAAREGVDRGAVGNGSQEGDAVPHGIYRCADARRRDRWCAISVFDDRQWRALADCVGGELSDARLIAPAARLRRAQLIDRALGEWTRWRCAEEVVEQLQAVGVPAGLVAEADDLLAGDPHLRQRRMWCAVPADAGETVELDAPAVRLSVTPGAIGSAGPLLGEHDGYVSRWLAAAVAAAPARA